MFQKFGVSAQTNDLTKDGDVKLTKFNKQFWMSCLILQKLTVSLRCEFLKNGPLY